MRGQLATESAVGRFLQKIGDAIASLSSSGRAAIETRNAVLHMAMANMLRQDPVINPTLARIPYPATPTRRNALAMYLGVAQALGKFPPEARAAARNLGLKLLLLQGLPEKGNPAEARGKALEVMNKILDDKVLCNILHYDYARDHEELKPMLPEMSETLRETFMEQKDRLIKPNGMHQDYIKDALRGAPTINGQPPDKSDLEGEFVRLISDPKIRGFLSMTASQAGFEFALAQQLAQPDKVKDIPDRPGLAQIMEKGLALVTTHNQFDIRVENGMARVKMEISHVIKAPSLESVAGMLGINPGAPGNSPEDKPLCGESHTFELVVDLTQDMEGKDIPDFELVNASRTPIIFPPPISIQPEG
jgi:hypothetical protein